MIKLEKKNITNVKDTKQEETQSSTDSNYLVFIIIILIVCVSKINSLIIQYFLLLFICYFYNSLYGVMFCSVIFYIFNINTFFNISYFTSVMIAMGIILNIAFIFVINTDVLVSNYLTKECIDIFIIIYNISLIFFTYQNNKDLKIENKTFEKLNGGATINKNDINFIKF